MVENYTFLVVMKTVLGYGYRMTLHISIMLAVVENSRPPLYLNKPCWVNSFRLLIIRSRYTGRIIPYSILWAQYVVPRCVVL